MGGEVTVAHSRLPKNDYIALFGTLDASTSDTITIEKCNRDLSSHTCLRQIMAYTEYFDFTSGLTLYGKAKPLNATWATGVVTMSENGSTGEYSSSSFVDDTSYSVFVQAGGSPASSDVKIGTITPEIVATGLTTEQAAKIALIGTGYAVINSPVSTDGDLVELIKDTDYLDANGRALVWAFDEIAGITTSATGRFGITNVDDGAEVYVNTTGTVTEPTTGNFQVSFDIINTAISALTPGNYDWSVEVIEGSVKITIARNRQVRTQVEVVEKQT